MQLENSNFRSKDSACFNDGQILSISLIKRGEGGFTHSLILEFWNQEQKRL